MSIAPETLLKAPAAALDARARVQRQPQQNLDQPRCSRFGCTVPETAKAQHEVQQTTAEGAAWPAGMVELGQPSAGADVYDWWTWLVSSLGPSDLPSLIDPHARTN